MENKEQTAVQWYAEREILLTLDFISKKITEIEYGIKKIQLFEQAKQMELQQLDDYYHAGYADARKDILQS